MAINETTGRKYHSTKGAWTSKTGLESWIYQWSAWIGWQISLERCSANNKFCKPPAKLKLDHVFHRPLQMENLNYEFPGGGTFRKFIYPPDWIQSESVNKVQDYFQWGYFHSTLTQVFLEKLKLFIFFIHLSAYTRKDFLSQPRLFLWLLLVHLYVGQYNCDIKAFSEIFIHHSISTLEGSCKKELMLHVRVKI